MKKLIISLLSLAAFAADAPKPMPASMPVQQAPTPNPQLLAEYFHAQLLATQAAAPCQAALVEPSKAVQAAIVKLKADAESKGATVQDGPNQTVIYIPKPAPEVKK
jgi:hypothetical protein